MDALAEPSARQAAEKNQDDSGSEASFNNVQQGDAGEEDGEGDDDEGEEGDAMQDRNSNDIDHDNDREADEGAITIDGSAVEKRNGNSTHEVTFANDTASAPSRGAPSSSSLSLDLPADGSTTGPPTPHVLVPCLKGVMSTDGVCKGVWAMSEAAHEQLGQTSEFEFKLVSTSDSSSSSNSSSNAGDIEQSKPVETPSGAEFPVSGMYSGWFDLKQVAPLKGSVKIEDRDMSMQFTANEDGSGYTVSGKGVNNFGSFSLSGTMFGDDNSVKLYREYFHLTPVTSTSLKRRQSFGGEDKPERKRKSTSNSKSVEFKTENGTGAPASGAGLNAESFTPRETGRVRRQSSILREAEEAVVLQQNVSTPRVPKKEAGASSSGGNAASASAPESTSERAHRLGLPLKRCTELLKELLRNPNSLWFKEPVDYVALNIPDYPKIVKVPMDFGTIQANIDAAKYETHDEFADHVRLVFKNAVTFNQSPENGVHVAAKELAKKFEERFRTVSTQLDMAGYPGVISKAAAAVKAAKSGSSSGAAGGATSKNKNRLSVGKSSGGGDAAPPKSIARSSSTASIGGNAAAPGPRASSGGGGGGRSSSSTAAALDNTAHQIAEIQRQMAAMQQEINELRTMVREGEITRHLREVQEASHNPLTLDEKKALIDAIQGLPMDLMDGVVEIIQSALPPSNGQENVDEVPLDSLDTYTMRKLQKYIEDNTKLKLRRTSSGPGGTSRGGSKGEKKTRKPRASNLVKQTEPSGANANNDPEGALLFSADSFGDIDLPAAAPAAAAAPPAAQQDSDLRRFRTGSIDEEFDDIVVADTTAASAPFTSSAAQPPWNSGN